MGIASRNVTAGGRRLLLMQLITGILCAVLFLIFAGVWQALSALYGMALCMLSAILLNMGVARTADRPESGLSAWALYGGAAGRFVLVLAGLAVGMGLFRLAPLAVVVGFVVAQMTFPFSAGGRRRGRISV